MILIKTVGDTGNLMFQYAFGFAAARRLGTSFCLNQIRKLAVFELAGDSPAANQLRKARFKVEALWHRPAEINWLEYNNARYVSPKTVLAKLADHTFYRGYFQSSAYYEGCEQEVKELFRLKEVHRRMFQERCGSLLVGPPLGVLHLRGTDYSGWEQIVLPWSYYENCLERVKDRENYRWIAVTDDPQYARQFVPPHFKIEIISGKVLDDFQLLNSARIHIMANSTFSWWAAYLNPDPAARIMGPKYWFGHKPQHQFEAPEGIMHPAWEWVETGGSMEKA